MDDKKLEQAMKNAEASLAVDELFVCDEGRFLVYKRLHDEISHEDFLKEALRMTKNE